MPFIFPNDLSVAFHRCNECQLPLAGHIGILIYGLFSRLASEMPDQTLFTDDVLPWYTLATALIALILLACAFLSEWYRLVGSGQESGRWCVCLLI